MINTNGYIKVIDFGIAKYLMKDYTNTIIGTPHYMSPEVILGKPYSFSVDYWSTGIVLYEIFYGRVPFGYDINDIKDIYKDIIEGNLILPSDQKNESFNNLISLLLNKNSSNRISNFINIKKHSFFENFNFDDLLEFKYKSFYQPKSNLEFSEEELLKNCNVSLLNFMRNHIYQSYSDIDENFLKESLINELNDF
jgi:serine/threonine protein kinase